MKIDRVFMIILGLAVIYLLFFKKEKMTADANTKKLIQDHYKIDVDAIRNLSKLANDLTKNGKLRIPGGLEVDGELNIKGESKFHKASWFQNQKKHNVWSHMNWRDGKVYLRGDVVLDGYGGTGKSLNLLPRGCIIAWNGNTPPKGWALCDGANGTPDLRGRFIRMATLNLPKNGNNDWSYHKYTVPKKGGVHHAMDTSKRGSSDAFIQNHKFNEKGGSDWRELHLGEMPHHNHTVHVKLARGGNPGNIHHGYLDPNTHWNSLGDMRHGHGHNKNTHHRGNNFGHGITPPYYVLTYIMKL